MYSYPRVRKFFDVEMTGTVPIKMVCLDEWNLGSGMMQNGSVLLNVDLSSEF